MNVRLFGCRNLGIYKTFGVFLENGITPVFGDLPTFLVRQPCFRREFFHNFLKINPGKKSEEEEPSERERERGETHNAK